MIGSPPPLLKMKANQTYSSYVYEKLHPFKTCAGDQGAGIGRAA